MNRSNYFSKHVVQQLGRKHWIFYPGMRDKFTINRFRTRRLKTCLVYPAYQRFVETRRKQSTKDLFRLKFSGIAYPRFLIISKANLLVNN